MLKDAYIYLIAWLLKSSATFEFQKITTCERTNIKYHGYLKL